MKGRLYEYRKLAQAGTNASVSKLLHCLGETMTIEESKYIDNALSFVESVEGLETMRRFLFHGTQIQRNYCTLFFSRRGDHLLVKEAYDRGLIDETQAFAR